VSNKLSKVSRRDFVRWGSLGGAALIVGLDAGERAVAYAAGTAPPAAFEPNAWIRIDESGVITIVAENAEMGQGVRTAVPLMMADELGADWARVRVANASPGPRYPNMRTSGSSAISDAWIPMRTVAAAAREMLVTAAATAWGVAPSTCTATSSVVTHAPTGRRMEYGALVAAASALPVPAAPTLRTPAQRTLMGTRVLRVDGPAIVTGRAQYGLDMRVPGMRFAAIARPPQFGATVGRWNDARARTIPGVAEVFEVPSGVVVIADRTWTAFKGRDALEVQWRERPGERLNSLEYQRALENAVGRGKRGRRDGDPDAVFASAARTMEATYTAPFQPHAAMEPLSCVAHVRDGACEIWVGTQAANEAQKEAATLLGIPPERVTINVQLLGGSFGRRLTNDFILEAVEVARKTRGPVQVVWSRADDFHHDIYQPGQVNRMAAALNAAGHPIGWRHQTADYHLTMFEKYDPNYSVEGNPWGAYDTPYAFTGLDVTLALLEAPVTTGAWRSVSYPAAVFARESFVDEVARATRRDPVALRLALIPSPGNVARGAVTRANGDRLRHVVSLAAERSGWQRPFVRSREGRRWGRGIACNSYHGGTMVAQVAEVSVGASNDIRVHRVVCAIDCGAVVNLAGVEGQVESGVIWGLSSMLRSAMRFENGRAVQSNFNDYRVVRMSEAPVVETHVVTSDLRAFGVGEQPVPPVWPAVANAVFDATGERIRSLPLMKG
jgi:isoquinoline 1-oxidoreductase subunit beta